MKKLPAFLFGIFFGATLMFVGLKYSVVRADNGFHLVSKSTAKLSSAYVDIREFTTEDWKQRIDLASDILKSDNRELQEEVTRTTVDNSIDSLWQELQSSY